MRTLLMPTTGASRKVQQVGQGGLLDPERWHHAAGHGRGKNSGHCVDIPPAPRFVSVGDDEAYAAIVDRLFLVDVSQLSRVWTLPFFFVKHVFRFSFRLI